MPSVAPAIRRLLALIASGLVVATGHAQAPSQVQLNGMLGGRAALLVIDGEARTVQLGESTRGVKLLALEDDRAVVEYGGRRQTLALGAAPGRLTGHNGTSRQIVLSMGSGGHFTSTGTINGQTTSFLVDTGATVVAISQAEADKLGLRYLHGKRIVTQTANGIAPAYQFQLASVRIGDIELRGVDAIVIPGKMSHVLLGNSFLNRFQMRRENDLMTLELRY